MTLSPNWPGRPALVNEPCAALLQQLRRLGKRWSLLARLTGLPPRARDALNRYHRWMNQQWWEAQAIIGRVDELLMHDETIVGVDDQEWLAFATGGAEAYVRAYDLGPGNVAAFATGAIYFNELTFSLAETRALYQRIRLLTRYMPERYRAARDIGELSATYWLAQAQERELERKLPNGEWRQPPPPPLTEQPPGYTDLLELELAREQRDVH